MKILKELPPNFEKIRKVFPVNRRSNILYAYGDAIYNPFGNKVPGDLKEHEKTHLRQQDGDPDAWWDKYLADPEFRLDQEVKAYRKQYEYYKKHGDRNNRRNFLSRISADLSSPLYGELITFGEAKKLISNESN